MTTVFVYEYCCALGLGREPSDPAYSLYREGRAMRDAVVEDFRQVSGIEVFSFPDDAAPVEEDWLVDAVNGSDWSLIVAPESERVLEWKVGLATQGRAKLLGPSVEAVQLTSDKLLLAAHWSRNAVPTPRTSRADQWPADRFPAVAKPIDGAGSVHTTLVRDRDALNAALNQAAADGYQPGRLIVQAHVPGRPASVAFLVGPAQTVPLLPTFQFLSSDGRFRYEGGELPIPTDLAERAITLGRRAIECVTGLLGYVGVDLILGEVPDGSQDYAIEINPRLTTSYVGLRMLANFNLAEAILQIVNGAAVEPRWKAGRVRFRPDGSVSVDPTQEPGSS